MFLSKFRKWKADKEDHEVVKIVDYETGLEIFYSSPDEQDVEVEGGEDGDGEGQEQGEDKGDPSVPVRTFAQAVLQSFWGGRGKVAEKNHLGGTFGASLLLNRAKAMLYFSIQALLEFRMMSWTFMKCEHLPKNWIEDRMRGRTKEKLKSIQ